MQPDYSRQLLLKEIGARGQAALARGRVLVVGAGGLGSPVLQYLAGAGVGCLGLVEADSLDASNLHRQPIYALEDVGAQKVALAAAAVKRINPTVQVETHAVKLDADNVLALIRGYDVVVDCSDNFRAKYLINDAAVLAHRPAVFASVYAKLEFGPRPPPQWLTPGAMKWRKNACVSSSASRLPCRTP